MTESRSRPAATTAFVLRAEDLVESTGDQRASAKKDVFQIHGEEARYDAIESDSRTREMYAKFASMCFWVTTEGYCLTEGTRIVKYLPR